MVSFTPFFTNNLLKLINIEMDLKIKYLEKLKQEQILAGFYTDNYDESDYGFVIDFNDDFLLIENFDNDCNYDGITIFMLQNITRIRWSGNDMESVAKLIDGSQRQKEKLTNIDLSSVQTILQSVNRLYNHLTVHIQDIDKDIYFIGQIHEMDENSIVIHEFGPRTSLDRKFILLSIDDITRVEAGGRYESNLKRLYNQ
jgi:hypothetical protein